MAAGRKDYSLNPTAQASLDELRQTLEAGKPVTNSALVDLVVMMCTQWDYQDRLAPLDVLRCIAASPIVGKYKSPSGGSAVQAATTAALNDIPAGAQPNENCAMMAARAIANLFKHPDGRKLLAQSSEAAVAVSFLERVLGIGGQDPIGPSNRNLMLAVATAVLNFAVLGSRQIGSLSSSVQARFLSILTRILGKQTDGEVVFRALVAAGTLITVIGKTAPEARSLSSSIAGAKDRVADQRVKEVADECLTLLG